MTLKAVIHPGMHKTGTSSIQETLASFVPKGWQALKAESHNLSGVMQIVFERVSRDSQFALSRGFGDATLQTSFEKQMRNLESQIESAAEKNLNIVFSAERISIAPEEAVADLADFFRTRGFRPQIIGYVRKPCSYMQSFFQQQLKVAAFSLGDPTGLWPKYRARFEKLDRVFGSENVQLKVFAPETLKGGDVVLDFYSELGAEIEPESVLRVNESLVLEACALLFVQRKFGNGFVQGFPSANAKNLNFIKTLSEIDGRKLVLKRALCEPIIEKFSRDLAWMENRMGVPLLDLPDKDADNAVGSDQDLIRIALENNSVVEDLLKSELEKKFESPRQKLVHNLEVLRKLHY